MIDRFQIPGNSFINGILFSNADKLDVLTQNKPDSWRKFLSIAPSLLPPPLSELTQVLTRLATLCVPGVVVRQSVLGSALFCSWELAPPL